MTETSIFKAHFLYEIDGEVLEFLYRKESVYMFYNPIDRKRVLKRFGERIRTDIKKIGYKEDFPEYFV